MTTLHRYVLRELLKTFGLAAVAITLLMVLAGGVYSMISQEGIGGGDALTFLPWVIGLAMTFAVPIAAIFAATIVYGRLAADNELLACRAAGINLTRLYLAAGLLAVFVGLFTTLFMNFVMPSMVEQMRLFVKSNVRLLAEHQLRVKGVAHWKKGPGQFFVTSRDVRSNFDPEDLRARDWDPELGYLWVIEPVFLQLDERGEVERFTVASDGMVQFDNTSDPVEVFAIVRDAWVAAPPSQRISSEMTPIGPYPIELPRPYNPAFLDLNELMQAQAKPWEFPPIGEQVEEYKQGLARQAAQQWIADQVRADGAVALTTEDGRTVRLTAGAVAMAGGNRVELTDVQIERTVRDPGRARLLSAPLAQVVALPLRAEEQAARVAVQLIGNASQPVILASPGVDQFGPPRQENEWNLTDLAVPHAVVQRALELPAQEVLAGPPVPEPPAEDADLAPLERQLLTLRAEAGALSREIISQYHARFGFATGTLIVVMIGATFGIIFKSNRALFAFGLSVVPLMVVGILLMSGRQNAERPGAELFGAAVVWGGLLLMAVGNAVLQKVAIRK
jgi:lipopolysaccharide export LptBFGC system permease protein LptF